ncbi:MAG: glycosyltransferase [Planctomycetaceae bacterium]
MTNKRIRVALSMGSLYGGGSERQLVQILEHLDRDRFEPFLYLVYQKGELLSRVPDDVPVHAFDVRTNEPKLYWPGRMHTRRVNDFSKFLREQEIDIAYDRTFHMTMIAGPATQAAGVSRVSTIVTDPNHDFHQIAGRFKKLKWRILRQAYLSADAVIGVSAGVTAAAKAFWRLPGNNLQTVLNSLDVKAVSQAGSNPFSTEDDGSEDRDQPFRIVAAGRLHPQKGFDLLIRATAKLVRDRGLNQLRVHILGDGPEEASLRQLIQSEGMTEYVSLEGYQTNANDWYRNSQLFVLSSRYEGMPNALMEAMACSVPVVAFDCPSGPAEVLREGAYGALVPAEDVNALAAAIGGVHDHYEPMKARAERAFGYIESEFALPTCVRKLEEVFETIVRGKNGSAAD